MRRFRGGSVPINGTEHQTAIGRHRSIGRKSKRPATAAGNVERAEDRYAVGSPGRMQMYARTRRRTAIALASFIPAGSSTTQSMIASVVTRAALLLEQPRNQQPVATTGRNHQKIRAGTVATPVPARCLGCPGRSRRCEFLAQALGRRHALKPARQLLHGNNDHRGDHAVLGCRKAVVVL